MHTAFWLTVYFIITILLLIFLFFFPTIFLLPQLKWVIARKFQARVLFMAWLGLTTRFANTRNGLEKLLFLHIQLLHSFLIHFILFCTFFAFFIRNIFFSEKFTAQIRTTKLTKKSAKNKKKKGNFNLLVIFDDFVPLNGWNHHLHATIHERKLIAPLWRQTVGACCWCQCCSFVVCLGDSWASTVCRVLSPYSTRMCKWI